MAKAMKKSSPTQARALKQHAKSVRAAAPKTGSKKAPKRYRASMD